MPVTYDGLSTGHQFPPVHYCLDPDIVTAYVESVGAAPHDHVPPLAVAARAIASLGDLIALPPGTIHAAQEFEFHRTVAVGSCVSCRATVARKVSRGPMRMLVLEMNIIDDSGSLVQAGRSTIVLPEA